MPMHGSSPTRRLPADDGLEPVLTVPRADIVAQGIVGSARSPLLMSKSGLFVVGIVSLFCLSAASGQAPSVSPAERARQAKTVEEAMAILGVKGSEPGRQVLLEVPDIAIQGRPVLIRATSKMPGTDQIIILAERRVPAMLEMKEFQPGVDHSAQVRAEFQQSTRVRVLVRASGSYFAVSREVKVAVPVAR